MLTTYLTGLRRLLRDANSTFWQDPELTDYINEARVRTVADTGCTRLLLTAVPLTDGVELYPFSTAAQLAITGYSVTGNVLTVTVGSAHYFQSGYTVVISGVTTPASLNAAWAIASTPTATTFTVNLTAAQAALLTGVYAGSGVVNISILDVLDVYLNYSNLRYPLAGLSFRELSVKFRPYVGYKDIPRAFAVYQENLYVGPVPFAGLTTDWDISPQPAPLVDDSTPERIPVPFQNVPKFYAAYLAKVNEQRQDEAEYFLKHYVLQKNLAIGSRMMRRIPGNG